MVKPPTTLKVAIIRAVIPKASSRWFVLTEKIISAPRMVTADMAFVIDMRGV